MGADPTQTNAINENTNQIDLPSCISIWPDSMDQRGRYQEDAGIKEKREGGMMEWGDNPPLKLEGNSVWINEMSIEMSIE